MTSETNPVDTSLDDLLNRHFAGKVVRKDLTKLVKEGANVPVYVLEYLLGMYCASDDDETIRAGLTECSVSSAAQLRSSRFVLRRGKTCSPTAAQS